MDKLNIDDLINLQNKLRKKLTEEKEKFNTCNNIDEKGMSLENINILENKIAILKIRIEKIKGTYTEEDDDLIKMPFEYPWSEEESLFYNIASDDNEKWNE